MRYEVIFKNLLRDFRKYYSVSFNQSTDYIKKQRYQPPEFLRSCLHSYVKNCGLLKAGAPISQQLLDQLVFSLGSLLYPKHMIKLATGGQSPSNSDRSAGQSSSSSPSPSYLLRDSKQEGWSKDSKSVLKVHNYLYRFSILRLQKFKKDRALIMLFRHYYESHGVNRITSSSTMKKYQKAYFEAASMILPKSEEKD